MRQALVGALVGAAVASAMSFAVPAVGGHAAGTSANSTNVAKKALKLAKIADKRSKQALKQARKVAAKVGGKGTQGPPGPPGPTQLRHVTQLGSTNVPTTFTVKASCAPDEVVTGGGSSSQNALTSYPASDLSGWYVRADGSTIISATADAVCAKKSP